MRKICTLMISMFAFLVLSAQTHTTRLSISSMKDISYVTLNGRAYYLNGRDRDRSIHLNNLSAGRYLIKVYTGRNGRGGGFGMGNAGTLLYQGYVQLRRGFHTDVFINRFGRGFTDEERIVYRSGRYQHDDDDDYYEYDDRWNQPHRQAMSATSFTQLKQTIGGQSFDQTKVNIARQAIKDNAFTAAQAKELLELLSFEDNKLELAKMLYPVTTDRSNFIIVYDVFNFSSSKDKLADYITQYRD
ncbi:MAG TPA: DUF4476 domain-containing protein [Ferruginibacter sp.]|nr:DUF4476 domain-containing protein [Ferruginibacter sp.]HRO17180.1 DUF4476 domain-containing protein [Ferruginibacter sp.]HRQ20354.1 DUF4476 domain-containing protein [Ferruginibacter sp.]